MAHTVTVGADSGGMPAACALREIPAPGHRSTGRRVAAQGTCDATCLADMDETGAAFVALPQIPPCKVNWFRKGKRVHLARTASAKYFLRRMRTAYSEPAYETYASEAAGVVRLVQRYFLLSNPQENHHDCRTLHPHLCRPVHPRVARTRRAG